LIVDGLKWGRFKSRLRAAGCFLSVGLSVLVEPPAEMLEDVSLGPERGRGVQYIDGDLSGRSMGG